jgi:CheY-like chemotaxis protein
MTQVLLVEDNVDDAHIVMRALRGTACAIRHVRNGAEAQEAARQAAFDVVLLDHRLPDISGIRVCRILRDAGIKANIVLVSSAKDDDTAQQAFEAGANDYLIKGLVYGDEVSRYMTNLLAA